MNNVKRNDECPCNSGKKYKKCCSQEKVKAFLIGSDDWHKIRITEGQLIDKHFLPYIKKIPQHVIDLAFALLFSQDFPDDLDRGAIQEQFFIPWFFFNWVTSPQGMPSSKYDYALTASENYEKYYGYRLIQTEKNYIEIVNKTYYSFYQVVKSTPYQSVEVIDLFLDTQHTLHEISGSTQLQPGDILFSRIVTIDGNSVFFGMMPFAIPPRFYHYILEKKKTLTDKYKNLDSSSLRQESRSDLIYWSIDFIINIFKPPIIKNTDGDLLEFNKIYFTLKTTPKNAFEKLKHLAVGEDPQELLDSAEYHENGTIKKIIFSWSKAGNKAHTFWNNTILGTITIHNSELILETNSKSRLNKGKKLIEKNLTTGVVWKKTESENIQPYSRAKKNNNPNIDDTIEPNEEMNQYMKDYYKQYWHSWLDKSIPALNDLTPREAAKTDEGKKLLNALFLDFEQHNRQRKDDDLLKIDIVFLKKELGLS